MPPRLLWIILPANSPEMYNLSSQLSPMTHKCNMKPSMPARVEMWGEGQVWGRGLRELKEGEKAKRRKGEKGFVFISYLFSFSPFSLFPFSPLLSPPGPPPNSFFHSPTSWPQAALMSVPRLSRINTG